MTPQDWESPAGSGETFGGPVGTAAVEGAELAAVYAMRPLSLSEVLDRTFTIYRSRFWLFAGISSLSGAVQLLGNALNLVGQHLVTNRYGPLRAKLASSGGTLTSALVFMLAAAVTQAATVYALSEVYLGRGATVGDSIRATIKLWYRYCGIALWQVWSAIWLGLLLAVPALIFFIPQFGLTSLAWLGGIFIFLAVVGGMVYGAIAYIRNSLGVQAAVVEQSKVRASMRRSKNLTTGTKGRIFVVLLVAVALSYVGGAIEIPLAIVIARAPLNPHVIAQAMLLAITFVTHTLVTPVALIGLSLVYFDQRVRREAFDLVMLMGGEMHAPAVVNAAPVDATAAPVDAASGPVDLPIEATVVDETPVVEGSIGNDGQI
jgi:hypothetical protein